MNDLLQKIALGLPLTTEEQLIVFNYLKSPEGLAAIAFGVVAGIVAWNIIRRVHFK